MRGGISLLLLGMGLTLFTWRLLPGTPSAPVVSEISLTTVIEELRGSDERARETAARELASMAEGGVSLEQAERALRAATEVYPPREFEWQDSALDLMYFAGAGADPRLIPLVEELFPAYSPSVRTQALALVGSMPELEAARAFVALATRFGRDGGLSLLPTHEPDSHGRHAEVYCPGLLGLADVPEFDWPIFDLCLGYLEQGLLAPEQAREHADAFLDSYRGKKEQLRSAWQDAAWMTDVGYSQDRATARVLLELFGFLHEPAVQGELAEALLFDDPVLRLAAVLGALKQRLPLTAEILSPVAASAQTRLGLYEALEKHGQLDLFPSAYLTRQAFAEADVIEWLDFLPAGMELVEVVVGESDDGPLEAYLYRLQALEPDHGERGEGWVAAASNLFLREETTSPWPHETLYYYETWESRTPEQHRDAVRKLILDRQRPPAGALLGAGDRLAEAEDYAGALHQYKEAYEVILGEVRGLDFVDDVDARLMTRGELHGHAAQMYEEEVSDDDWYAVDRAFEALGLIPPSLDLEDLHKQLFAEEVAGFYDPRTKDLVLVDEMTASGADENVWKALLGPPDFDPLEQKFVMAHELAHALQDQHFDLTRIHEATRHDDDMALAATALIEGDAMVVAYAALEWGVRDPELFLRTPPETMDLVFSGLQWFLPFVGGEAYRQSPPLIRDAMMFPYHKGLVFVLTLTNRGGWDRVNDGLRAPPVSTEQILHPAKFGEAPDEPTHLELPDLVRVAGSGWRAVRRNVLGEFQMRSMFAGQPAAAAVAAGWDGDQYEALENEVGELGLVWLTSWDTREDALEFATHYAAHMQRKVTGDMGGAETGAGQAPVLEITRANRAYRMAIRARDVAIVEGFSPEVTGRLVEAAFRAEKTPKTLPRSKPPE